MKRVLRDFIDRETAGTHLEALQLLVNSPGCPQPALQISGFAILRLLGVAFVTKIAAEAQSDLTPMRQKVLEAIGLPNGV